MSLDKNSTTSPSSPSSSTEDKSSENISLTVHDDMTSSTPIQPVMSQAHYSSMSQNASSGAQTVVNNSAPMPSTPSPITNQNPATPSLVQNVGVAPNPQQNSQPLMTQTSNHQMSMPQSIQSSVAQAPQQITVSTQQTYPTIQQSRIPTPQPQQIVNSQLTAPNTQTISPSLTAPQANQITTQQLVQATTPTSQFPGQATVQPMNIQLQHPSQMTINPTQQSAQMNGSNQNSQIQAAQQNLPSQVHQIHGNQHGSPQLVQQHPGTFSISQGQTTFTVSMSQPPTSVTPTAHIAPAPHAVAAHPPVTPSPVPQLQVIQHPIQNQAYIHPIYATGTHQGTPLMFPSNLTIQPANMGTFQSLGVNQTATRNIALPHASIDPSKQAQTATIMPVGVSNKSAAASAAPGSVVQQAGQVQIAAATSGKPTVSQMINATAVQQGSKSVYASQPGQYTTIPCSTVNGHQTFVIGQLGVLSAGSQQASAAILPAKSGDPNQKSKPFTMGITSSLRSPIHHTSKVMSGTLQSKSPILPHPACSTATVLSGTHFKQLSGNPQVITSQTPTAMIASHAQFLGSFQPSTGFAAPGQLAQSINWAAPNCLQSQPVIQPNTQILIRSPHNGEMFFHSPASQPTFQAVAQPQLQAQPTLVTTSASITPVASVAPSSTTTVTTSSAPAQKPKQTPEQNANIFPRSTTIASMATTITSTTRNLSTILPASSSVTPSTLPTAQVRPASAVSSSPNKNNLIQQNKVKARPRVSAGPSGVLQGQVRPTPVGIGQKIERQTQTLAIPQKSPRMPTLIKPTTVAQKLAGTSIASSPKPPLKPVLSMSHPKPATNVNIVAPELVKQTPSTKTEVAPHTSICISSAPTTPTAHKPPTISTPTATPLPTGGVGNNAEDKKEVETSPPQLEASVNETANANKVSVVPKEKQPQKAIVKPNVLTHVIEGFIILEASEPFPVNRSSPTLNNSNNVNSTCNDDLLNGNNKNSSFRKKRKASTIRNKLDGENSIDDSDTAKDKKGTPEPPLLQDESVPPSNENKTESSSISSLEEMDAEPAYDENSSSPPTLRPAAQETYLNCYNKNPVKWTDGLDLTVAGGVPGRNFFPVVLSTMGVKIWGAFIVKGGFRLRVEDVIHLKSTKTGYSAALLMGKIHQVQEVYEFIHSLPGCTDYADEFLSQEIDGQALLLLKEEHLVTTMNVKLGPALKICSKVSSLRDEHE